MWIRFRRFEVGDSTDETPNGQSETGANWKYKQELRKNADVELAFSHQILSLKKQLEKAGIAPAYSKPANEP